MSYSRTAIKLKFGRDKFGKRIVLFKRLESVLKKSQDQADEITGQHHLSKRIINVSFNFMSCQEIRK